MICLGLIGLGQAAQILHIPNIEKMENKFEITAVADISYFPKPSKAYFFRLNSHMWSGHYGQW